MASTRITHLRCPGNFNIRKKEDNSQVFVYNYVGNCEARLHQEWIVSEEPEGFYRSGGAVCFLAEIKLLTTHRDSLQCAKTGTFLEIQQGCLIFRHLFALFAHPFRSRFSKPDNGIKATCSKRVDGGDHQLWELERATRTTAEIKSILQSWKPDILSRLFQPHDDENECVPATVQFREQSSPMINSIQVFHPPRQPEKHNLE